MSTQSELEQIRERYARRTLTYDPMTPWVYCAHQEKERAIIRWYRAAGLGPVKDCRLLEVGCGSGSNLQLFLRLGFEPHNLVGIELLPDRVEAARAHLPAGIRVIAGDASADAGAQTYDVVFQSLVFTSILDPALRQALALRMWQLVRPGGGVLWYDFTYDNPANPDVRGVRAAQIRALFPEATLELRRVTLAPPLARVLTNLHPSLYQVANFFPFLRTHLLCWLRKPSTVQS